MRRRGRSARPLSTRFVAPVLLLLLVLAAPEAAPPSAAAADVDESGLSLERYVRHVHVHGNTSYGEGTLRKLLRTRGSSFWKPWRKNPLRSDYVRFDRTTLQDFYRRHGYLSARVDSVATLEQGKSDRADVHFYLTEGPRYLVESVRFEGTSPIPLEELEKALTLRAGEPFDVPREDLSRQAVENKFLERGFIAARVRDSLEIDTTSVRIVHRIATGPQAVLGEVKVEGTSATKPEFVTREVVLDPGDVLARSKLVLSQQRIYDSGFYADVQFDRGAIDSVTAATDLIVGVRERKMGWVDAGVGYGTVDQVRLTTQVGQRNLWRDGYSLVATGRLGVRVDAEPWKVFQEIPDLTASAGDRRLDLTLSRLWILGIRMSAALGGYAEAIPEVPDKTNAYQAYGGTMTFGYAFTRATRARLAYEHRRVESDSSQFRVAFDAGRKRYSTNRIILTGERDTRDNAFNSHRGMDIVGTSEFVGGVFRGSANFLKLVGTWSGYVPARRGLVLAVRLRAGVITPKGVDLGPPTDSTIVVKPLDLIPEEDRFRTGGANSVRGYRENDIGTRIRAIDDTTTVIERGGRILLLGNAELRFPLIGIIGGVAFVDAGNVWVRRTDIKLDQILSFSDEAGYNDMRYGVGVGLRLGTPIGPLRFDYGWKLRLPSREEGDATPGPGEFHFSVGQTF